jgi:diaminohydroxyphosphoribosylaminopyrimidine deaminase/5-amino-6-(5-phosphoribosylamino)uracil reductase
MNLCLKEAWRYQGLTYPNPAVGSLILDENDKLLGIDAHKKAADCHAELSVISKVLELLGDTNIAKIEDPSRKHQYILENHNNKLKNFTIFVTLEPCNHTGSTPPCSILIKTLKFRKIIIGSMDPNPKASGGAKLLKEAGLEVIDNILTKKTNQLIEPFLKWQSNKSYIFFKLAKTQNGVYTGGTISSLESRVYVHKIREIIDLLAIGGNTVKIDRPTLDCRLTGGDAPDICIYTKDKNIDKTIPLFAIKNRDVTLCNSLDFFDKHKFIMIEGGEGMLKAVKHIVDHVVLFTSNDFKVGKTIQIDLKLEKIYDGEIGLDRVEWFKII